MFNHEIMSKKHVKEHELDRLCGVHKSLMTSGSNYLRRELFPMKRTFEEYQSVGSTRSLLGQDFGSVYQQRQLDLQPLAGKFCNDNVLDEVDLELPLGIGTSTNKRSRTSEKLWKKIMYPSSQDTVDLGESTVTGWNENAFRVFYLDKSSQSSTDCLNKIVNLQQDHLKIDQSCKKKESLVKDGMCPELSSITQGSNGLHAVKPKVLLGFDLNEPPPEEYSFDSNKLLETFPSSDGSSNEVCSQITTPVTFKSQTEASTINLESHPEPSSDLTEEEDEEIHISDDLNIATQKAAPSLFSVSQQRQPSTSHQDSETELRSNKTAKNSNENTEGPLKRTCSIDSYEALCLNLEPLNMDEDCLTSKAYDIKDFDEKKSGIKLKRGRRLKDFQRDILPTISVLTRREILDDLNLWEGVLRSREYQKYNKDKTGKGENWFTPVRSKRSRASYAGSNKNRSS